MTNEERDIIASFVARVGGAASAQQSPWGGASVPATQAQSQPAQPPPALPPVDPEADGFIADQFQRYPEARYRITQLAFVQEHALIEAQSRIRQLQAQLQQMQQAAQAAQQQAGARPGGGGFFSSLFGGGSRPAAGGPPPGGSSGGPWGQPGQAPPHYYQQPQYAPPPPQYPPGYQPGVFQRQGSGFLGSALTTAAGVAGGIFAADAIRDMFAPRQEFMGGGGFAGSPWGGPAAEPGAGPWADPAAGQGYVDQGQWDQGSTDPGTWNDPGQAAPDTSGGGGWDQGGADQGGGWDQGGGGDQSGGWDQGGGGDWGGGGGGSDDNLI